ncbi:transaldolase [Luteimicrobium subarcticum]|uniref:Transaldolase n=1 Tax=Luteimicrobium subarcticum TaxID=620910 RepID=A0A2M8W3C3_9MICO|nr:transaldolase [Luteimicrobium subarcticum]PJI85425.1 transaldolase [Luteimicrobium subarcticum]
MTDSNTDSTTPTRALSEAGVSIWLDDLSRERLRSGSLADLVARRDVVGVTTNPTIFAKALSEGDAYDEQLGALAGAGVPADEAVWTITTDDVRAAADVLRPVYDATDGVDGRVSIEVDPRLARDTDGTVALAQQLWKVVDRPNVMIKIPATVEGLPAITRVLAEGISVNVTLIFSLERYGAVIDAFVDGIEGARAAGLDLTRIGSVASFFLSRVDTAVDKALEADGSEAALAERGTAALSNARLAYELFGERFGTDRWQDLAAAGAHVQRPLWASTGTKNPEYSDTLYVTELVAPHVVNTMPEKTLDAVADHGDVTGDTITGTYDASRAHLAAIESSGVSMAQVTQQLEDDGVASFVTSWDELLETITAGLAQAGDGAGA